VAVVINQDPVRDGNCLVVWCNATGRPTFGSFYNYKSHDHVARYAVAEAEWVAAIDSAVVLAERNGIPTVYVVED
jgi:hypothetical protein